MSEIFLNRLRAVTIYYGVESCLLMMIYLILHQSRLFMS